MPLLTLSNAELAYGDLPLLDGASFALDDRERVGLIGRNGTGKSSLLGVLAGNIALDDGELKKRDGLRIVLVPQEPAFPARPPVASRRVLHDVCDGATFVFGHPLLRPIFLTQLVFNTAAFVLQAVYVPYAVHRLGLSALGVGLTLATYGVGMVVGALLAPRIMRVVPFGLVIVLGPIAGLAAGLVMVLTLWVGTGWLAAFSFFLLGAGPIVWVISTATLRQTVTPAELLGRASALSMTATGARPIGAALGALLGASYGVETCLVVAAVGFFVQAVLIVASPVPALARQPLTVA